MFNWDETPELNITPLVDIMLVLLAILMVTTPAIIHEGQISLPKGSKSKSIEKIPDIEIRIDKNRGIYIKKIKYDFDTFADSFILYSQNLKKLTPVFIRADKSLRYEDVIYVLKSVKEAGFTKVSLVTDG